MLKPLTGLVRFCCAGKQFIAAVFFIAISIPVFAQNDNCSNATAVNITNAGFDLGIFTSAITDISTATVQPGETFAPAILVAGQTQKSIWYKFTLPTNRSVKVTLAQNGSAIQAGDAGFAVYKTNTCLPTVAQISTKLTPIGLFGSTFHPCVEPGDYMVQVSAKAAANGPVYITVELASPTSLYDKQTTAYQFGTLAAPDFINYVDYPVDCQTIEDASEVCSALSNYQQYNKSTWHTFKTPAYFDYVAVTISGTGSPYYFTNSSTYEKFGYNLYQGDARIVPYSSLALVDGCDTLMSNGYSLDKRIYKCAQLQPNTVYSVQLFFKQDFNNSIRLGLTFDGTAPTNAPEPILSLIPASNKLGTLASNSAGITTNATDQLGCNARHSLHPCNPSLPAGGIPYVPNNYTYNLSTFFTFNLANTARLAISATDLNPPYRFYTTPLSMRLYRQDVTNNCNSLDTINLAAPAFLSNSNFSLDCVPPGNYTLQISGRDTLGAYNDSYYYGYLASPGYVLGFLSDLGKKFKLFISVYDRAADNKFNLKTAGAFDTVHAVSGIMQPMVDGVIYNNKTDTFGCGNTVRPSDTTCDVGNNKVVYRQMIIPDSGVVALSSPYSPLWSKLYLGNADSLAAVQNVHFYPSRITGLVPYTKCIQYNGDCGGMKVCVVPGTYTHATFGGDANVGQISSGSYLFFKLNTTHHDAATSENMGNVVPGAGAVASSVDYFSCKDNAVPINGYYPCPISGDTATKAIYREFYLTADATLTISTYTPYCGYYSNPYGTLFRGRASTDGIAGLTVIPKAAFQCFQSAASAGACDIFSAGWYTVVTYGSGPTYENPFQNLNQYGYSSYVGIPSRVTVDAAVSCPGQKYNRPYKAAIDSTTGQPFLIEWANRAGHTSAYPKTDTTFILYKENFNCAVDTPFLPHTITSCSNTSTKVAYYIFRTTQEAYMQINTKSYLATVYRGNARTDSALFDSSRLIQPCITSDGFIQLCKLQPGTYTLIIFANNSNNCSSVEPTIYIDKIGYSRFDYASNAYDFGVVPPDSLYHGGKVGDVNPLDPGRRPSSDIIYCTTGAFPTDPSDISCYTVYNPNIYSGRVNMFDNIFTGNNYQIPKRNLWYTFVVNEGGTVRVQVVYKTPGANKGFLPRFAVYRSNVDGTLPFSTVVSTGQVDSTQAQGLTLVANNNGYYYYCFASNVEASFYRDPCSAVQQRYYIVVENPSTYPYDYSGMQPNYQVDVAIQVDSVNAIQPKFDHYYQASNIGTNLGAGTYTSATDNYSCATHDATEPTSYFGSCGKSLWYKFSTNVTGYVRFRAVINGQGYGNYDLYHIQLFKQNIAGDSTANGLQILNSANPYYYDPVTAAYWGQTCISPGTYYLILPGCYQVNENVYTQIQVIEQAGDFCSAPVNATLNGAGTNVSSVIVDCHTIGTDYGEFNPTLTCPAGGLKQDYKTSWFKINITGTDTLDVTTYLSENTNASPSQIKYRLMNGNCGAMQERSCVQDAQTQDTYKCLAPGEYFIQVFTPVVNAIGGQAVTGTIDLHLSAVHHADTCAPPPGCLANATFIPQFDCNLDDSAVFVNYSTYGSAIQYTWNFGYAGQTSTAVAPKFKYPELATNATYTVTLTVLNTGCSAPGNTTTATGTITIPGRPKVNLGNDTTLCTPGSSLLLHATTWPGSTYYWQNGSTDSLFNVTASGMYYVKVTYNGCTKIDTIKIYINTITPYNQTKTLCGNDSVQLSSLRSVGGETYLWNTGATTSSIYASTPGIYTDDLNWRGCIIRDSFKVNAASGPFVRPDTMVCFPFQSFLLDGTVAGAQSYQWQNGSSAPTFNVTAPGQYWVNVTFSSCVVKDTIQVNVSAAPAVNNSNANICAGQTYALPWGPVVNATGIYRDTIKTIAGCDSIRRSVNLTVQNVLTSTANAGICAGQSYTLPWGTVVNAAGTYRDTIHYTTGCDSLRRTVILSVALATSSTTNVSICTGQTYTLANGTVVSTAGIYSDTLHYAGGCDSVRRTVNLTVQNFTAATSNATMCPGQTYTLPWGTTVSTAGTYRDTLHYITGCDSVRRTVNLTIQNFVLTNTSANICAGQTYVLPWGTSVTTAGTYRDTLHYTTGCDSVRRTVNLTVQNFTATATNANICAGQSYTLPWGVVVNTPGTYKDTLHYLTGCDSLRRTVVLTQQNFTAPVTNASICSGLSYTLPWGTTVSTAGTYRDTLHYTTGCDSVRRTVNLTIQNFVLTNTSANICAGQTYLLPWGTSVTTAGTYRDTLHYTTGCDSVRRTIILTVQSATATTSNANICAGQSYTLPWGVVVNTPGTYKDTLHYLTGCDSIRRTVILTQQNFTAPVTNASICSGQNYTLPWGAVVNTSGTYKDTLHYISGCDSVRRTINLTVQNFTTTAGNPNICAGQSYILPWGAVVSTAGTYRDTLHYTTGCDSVRRSVILTVQSSTATSNNANICAGQSYTLPWGVVVNTPGTYKDTLHYLTGCDSLRRSVTLTVQSSATSTINATICAGQGYTLPSGVIATAQGIYRDTLHYTTGCDSLQRAVNLTVTQAAVSNTTASICSDQTYTTPWGTVVNTTGIYKDTLHSITGCDSLIRNINLTVNPAPLMTVTKSNDVNCAIGIARLNVYGAGSYIWSPAISLTNANSSNPVASPTKTTMYVVIGMAANGCISKDSIEVKFISSNPASMYLVPSSFTPNNDGLNDCFGVPYWGAVTDFKFTIHSRWGELLFETTNPSNCWDGTYKGRKQDQGAYIYQITANGVCGPITRRGAVVLVR